MSTTKDEQLQRCKNALIAALLETAEQCQSIAVQLGYEQLTPEIAAIWSSDAMIERVAGNLARTFPAYELYRMSDEYGRFSGGVEDQQNYFAIVDELRKVFE